MLGKDKPNRFGAASQLAVKAQVFLSPTYPCDGWNLALSGMHIYGWYTATALYLFGIQTRGLRNVGQAGGTPAWASMDQVQNHWQDFGSN